LKASIFISFISVLSIHQVVGSSSLNQCNYVVVSGDSFYSIAEAHGCNLTALEENSYNLRYAPNYGLDTGNVVLLQKQQCSCFLNGNNCSNCQYVLESNYITQCAYATGGSNFSWPSKIEYETPNQLNSAGSHIVAYYPAWSYDNVSLIRYDRLTHIIYAFLIPKTNGNFSSFDELYGSESSENLRTIVSLAHQHGVKVLVSFGGSGGGSAFPTITESSSILSTFTQNVLNYLEKHDLDGADIDWEFPDTTSKSNGFQALMESLSSVFKTKGYLLSAAVSSADYYGQWIPSGSFPFISFLNVMAYDMTGPGTAPGNPDPWNESVGSGFYWTDRRGFPASKVCLGVAFYGENFTNSNDVVEVPWSVILTLSATFSPCTNELNDIYFSGWYQTAGKAMYAKESLYYGVMFWEYAQDTNNPIDESLLSAIQFGFSEGNNSNSGSSNISGSTTTTTTITTTTATTTTTTSNSGSSNISGSTTITTTTSNSNSPGSSSKSKTLDTGAVIAIACTAGVVSVAGAVALVFFYRKHQQKKGQQTTQ